MSITPDLPFKGVTRILLEDGWHDIVAETLTAVSNAANQPPTTFRWTEMVALEEDLIERKMTFICPASSVKALCGPFQEDPTVQIVPASALPKNGPGGPRRIIG